MSYVRWNSLPLQARKAVGRYIRPGDKTYRPKPVDDSFHRQVRAFFAEEIDCGTPRTEAVFATAEAYHLHRRTVWRIIRDVKPCRIRAGKAVAEEPFTGAPCESGPVDKVGEMSARSRRGKQAHRACSAEASSAKAGGAAVSGEDAIRNQVPKVG